MENNFSTNKIGQWLILLFFVSLPFERLFTLDFAGYTIKLSYILGIIILIYALVLLAKKQFSLTLYRDEIWLGLFSLLAILTTLWSIDQKRSLLISLTIVFMFLLFCVLRRIIDEKLKESLISLTIIIGFLLSLFALWQFFVDNTALSNLSYLRPQYSSVVFGFPRVQSTFLEPLYLANFLLIPIFFNFYRLTKKSSLNGYSFLTVTTMAFFLTLSRGAFFALALGLLLSGILIIIYQRKFLATFLKSLIFIILAGGLAAISIYSVAGGAGVKSYAGHATVNDIKTGESVVDRKYTMNLALDTSLINYFGIGAGAFGALPEFKNDIATEGYQTVNNLYLEILVEEGFLGLILFLLFIWSYFSNLVKGFADNKIWTIVCVGLFLAILAQYLFFSTIYIIYIWAVLAILTPKLLPNYESH